jgi:caffeoyl-CoA O-methyltransferase
MDITAIEQYAINHTTDVSPDVKALIEESERDLEYTDMLSGKLVGRLLAMLIKLSGAQCVLEIGTFTGYSALTMAEALPADGVLYTCEYNRRYENIAREFFAKSDAGSKVTLLMGKALETIPTIEGSFDFVFLDADKINYPSYYKMMIPRLEPGGIMAIDNVFWGGEVLEADKSKAEAIDKLNKMIVKDDSVEQVMLTIRDGLTIVRRL